MTGIQYVTDDKGRKTGVLIDLKKHGALWQDFWDGLVADSRRKEKSVPYEEYRANRVKRKLARHLAEGLEDARKGRTHGPYANAADAMKALDRRAKRHVTKRAR